MVNQFYRFIDPDIFWKRKGKRDGEQIVMEFMFKIFTTKITLLVISYIMFINAK